MLLFVRMMFYGDPDVSFLRALEALALQDAIITGRDKLKLESEPNVRREALLILTKQHPPHIQKLVERIRADLGVTPGEYVLWEKERYQMIAEKTEA